MAHCRSFGIVSKAVILILALFSFLHANQLTGPVLQPQQPSTSPWLTGPLIAPPGTAIQKGHFEIESYLYVTTNTGTYDKHWHAHNLLHNFCSINPQIFSLFGITEWMDFQIIPQLFYNITQNKSSIHFGDLPAGFDFQLYPAETSGWIPGVKFTLREPFLPENIKS